MERGRTGGFLAIGLSSLWALAGASMTVIGVVVLVQSREDFAYDLEDFYEVVGGGFAFVGALVLAAALSGLYLGVRLFRGRPRTGLTIALYGLFAAISGMFLASAFADETGADPGGILLFGANTGICVFVILAALATRRA